MSATVTLQLISDRFNASIEARRSDWTMRAGKARSLDLVNHILRCILQLGKLEDYTPEFEAVAACQHEDGGWADISDNVKSGVRNTCFSARNLIRANRVLKRNDFAVAIEKAIRFVISKQDSEGFWPDPKWGFRDPTSSSMGLMVYTLKEDFGAATEEIHSMARACLAKAADWLDRTQAEDGSWPDEEAYEAPIGPTGHLLPKLVLARGEMTPAIKKGIDYLLSFHEENGSWDDNDVDHTCDASRGLLLTYSVVKDDRLPKVLEAGVKWLLTEAVNSDGLWGTAPGKPTNLTMVCDVLDCFSKYDAHRQALNLRMFWE